MPHIQVYEPVKVSPQGEIQKIQLAGLMKSVSQTCVARLMFSLLSDKSFQLDVDKMSWSLIF